MIDRRVLLSGRRSDGGHSGPVPTHHHFTDECLAQSSSRGAGLWDAVATPQGKEEAVTIAIDRRAAGRFTEEEELYISVEEDKM